MQHEHFRFESDEEKTLNQMTGDLRLKKWLGKVMIKLNPNSLLQGNDRVCHVTDKRIGKRPQKHSMPKSWFDRFQRGQGTEGSLPLRAWNGVFFVSFFDFLLRLEFKGGKK